MEFSLVNGVRSRPRPDLRGVCGLCGGETYSRCGPIRVHHWAHFRAGNCDPWWEPETEWHRAWKSWFPESNREVTVVSENGERHRADVKTDIGRVIEFQYSPIRVRDQRVREEFYGQMVWVVCGHRIPKDVSKFASALEMAKVVSNDPLRLTISIDRCNLLKRWSTASVDVYLDFSDEILSAAGFKFGYSFLWQLKPSENPGRMLVTPVRRRSIVESAIHGSEISGVPTTASVPEVKPKPEPIVLQHRRRKGESDIDFALRVWGIEDCSEGTFE